MLPNLYRCVVHQKEQKMQRELHKRKEKHLLSITLEFSSSKKPLLMVYI